jgi:hypothetical protein
MRCWKCGKSVECTMQDVLAYSHNGWPKSECCHVDMGLFAEVERPVSDQLLIAKVAEIQHQNSN